MKLKNLFLLLAGLMVAMSCGKKDNTSPTSSEGTSEEMIEKGKVELSASLFKIKADGVETAKFTVLSEGKDVTSEAKIYKGTSTVALSINEFKSSEAGTFEFVAEYNGSQSNKIKIEAIKEVDKGNVEIRVSSSEIIANGTDKCTFSVHFNGVDVTAESAIYDSKGTLLENKEFSTTIAGDYKFYAEYDSKKSELIGVSAVEDKFSGELTLTASVDEIADNGKESVTFKVRANSKLVTADSRIYNITTNSYLQSNVFNSTIKGTYQFCAEYMGAKSDTITVNVIKKAEVVISADKYNINADGKDVAKITVTADGVDVTKDAEIFTLSVINERVPVDFNFVSTRAGVFKISAEYATSLSNTITITATAQSTKIAYDFELPDRTGKKYKLSDIYTKEGCKYVYIDFWASWCEPCKAANPILSKIYSAYKGKGFEIVGVSIDNNMSDWTTQLNKTYLAWINLWDEKKVAMNKYGVGPIPHGILIDRNGIILYDKLAAARLEDKLKELFAKETVY